MEVGLLKSRCCRLGQPLGCFGQRYDIIARFLYDELYGVECSQRLRERLAIGLIG